jgi:hypothetical protein
MKDVMEILDDVIIFNEILGHTLQWLKYVWIKECM